MRGIYEAYEAACQRAGVIDFSELLLRALDLWRDHPGLLAHYQKRFRHILVDEFQDTNAVQYAWLRLLGQGRRQPDGGRRRRSVDLRLARREDREHLPVLRRLPGRTKPFVWSRTTAPPPAS
jgi:superfamily I DNA/RNA helicase